MTDTTIEEFINQHQAYLTVALAILTLFITILLYLRSRKRPRVVVGNDYDSSFRHKGSSAFSFPVINRGNTATSITNATCSFYSSFLTMSLNLPHTKCFASEEDIPHKLGSYESWQWQVNLVLDKHHSYSMQKVRWGKVIQSMEIPLNNTTIVIPRNKVNRWIIFRLYTADRNTPERKIFGLDNIVFALIDMTLSSFVIIGVISLIVMALLLIKRMIA